MQINANNFEQRVLRSTVPVLVDFWASWCAPCKMMEPLVERLAREFAGRIDVLKLNIDRNPSTAARCDIQSVPTFVLYAHGQEASRRVGAQTENQLRSMMQQDGLANAALATAPYVTVVSGLPRSGTSLMMRMLEAGGIAPLTDQQRAPDANNPEGYYELEAVKHTAQDASWLGEAPGKAVKMVYRLIGDLPADQTYRVLFMRRDLGEILASQRLMLQRCGRAVHSDDGRMAVLLRRDLASFLSWADAQPHVRLTQVSFNDLLDEPDACLDRVSQFLEVRLDLAAMKRIIRPELYRNRAG